MTDDEIRILNQARTILKNQRTPNTREGGHADAVYHDAEHAVFQALNVTRAYLEQPISDDLMHNREVAA